MAVTVLVLLFVCLLGSCADPYSPCDFETADLCQYTQDTTDDFDWTRNSGETPTPYNGPTVDHTTGTGLGHYMYVETSTSQPIGDTARLISPSYRVYPDGQCLLFWAHMNGNRISTLRVSVKAGGTTTEIWSRSGNQGNQWFSVAVSILATGSYQVIFEGAKGLTFADIAIDDVSILQGACPDVDDCVPRGGRGPCEQLCANTVGSFACSCIYGFILHQDGLTCNEANTSLSWFDFYDEKVLSGHNTERIAGIGEEECARRCLVGTSTVPSGLCLSFDYDHQGGGACVLSTANKDTPGAVLSDSDPSSRFDHYHRRALYSPCDFETDLCQYTQDTTDDFNWTRDSGGTPTGTTGPTVDHTIGSSSGHYMYIETSLPTQNGHTARLISSSYRVYPDGQCLLFWAHMYGGQIIKGTVGTLKVFVKAGGTTTEIWSRSGNQGNQWFSVAVSIPVTGSYQVIFEGAKGANAHGDIAIDDVSILQGACPDVDECVPREGRGPCEQLCANTVGSFSCSCNNGYTLQQDGLICNDTNSCSPNPCVTKAHCTDVPAPGTGAMCTCQTGYVGDGRKDGSGCTSTGVQYCPTLTAPENGAASGGNSYQDVVQFTCNHGYQLIGDSSRTCQADGTWTGTHPTCTTIAIRYYPNIGSDRRRVFNRDSAYVDQ
ncbi:MAM and LDL-receptor class A domain-containing protein 1-like [Branchiostoma floridae x Branchiostoma japonicum]